MKIVVDINHPAHVHYFKNFIWEMERKGHEVLIAVSEKDVTCKLLSIYGLDYINIGSYGGSLIEKLVNIPLMDLKMYKAVKSFKPDIFVGFGSIRAAHVSYLLRKKCILFEDTEHSTEQIILYLPFVDNVCTPTCFKKYLGEKQVRYSGYIEMAHLHPNYFTPNSAILDEMVLNNDDKFIILRFVSWKASHDIGQYGIQKKVEFVKKLEKYGRVFITSEGQLEKKLDKYRLKVSPEKLHDLLYYASLYIGEGGTTASEAAILGTHAIHISTTAKYCGTFHDLYKYGLMWTFEDDNRAIDKAVELLQKNEIRKEGRIKREKLLKDKIDVTAFMIKFIENYSL